MQEGSGMAAAVLPAGTDRISHLLHETLRVGGEQQAALSRGFDDLRAYLDAQEAANNDDASLGDHDDDVRASLLLFVAKSLQTPGGSGTPNQGLPLSRLVDAAGTNFFEFFRELPVIISKLGPYLEAHGSSITQLYNATHWTEMHKSVIATGLLVKKYRDNFNRFMHQLQNKQIVMRLGWLVFLVLKIKLLPRFPDLVSCVELLACVINVLLANAPVLPDVLLASAPADGRPINTLRFVSDVLKTDLSRVSQQMSSCNAVLATVLGSVLAEWRFPSASSAAAGVDEVFVVGGRQLISHCGRFEGLAGDAARMEQAVAAFNSEYENHYSAHGEVDERDFLTSDLTRFASPREPNSSSYHSMAGKLKSSVPQTPAAQLGSLLQPIPPLQLGTSPALAQPQGSQPAPGIRSPGGRPLGPGSHTAAPPGSPVAFVQFSPTAAVASEKAAAAAMLAADGGALSGEHAAAAVAAAAALAAAAAAGSGAGGLHSAAAALQGHPAMFGMLGFNPGMHSPLPSMALQGGVGQQTPISEAMASAAWLTSLTVTIRDQPSPNLLRLFGMCEQNPATPIDTIVREMAAAVIMDEPAPMLPFALTLPSLSVARRTEAIKLYYHVLEAILASEERASMSSPRSFTALLSSAKFHKGLTACCCEVVLSAYHNLTCVFPRCLDALRLPAFDLLKTIPIFVRHLQNMPREVKRHMFLMEEKIVESLAWQGRSTLYALIMSLDARQPVNVTVTARQPAGATAEVGSGPAHPSQSQQQTSSSSPRGSGPSPMDHDGGTTATATASGDTTVTLGASDSSQRGTAGNSSSSDAAGADSSNHGGSGRGTRAHASSSARHGGSTSMGPPPSPKRPQAVAFSQLMSPLKKSRGETGAIPTSRFNEPLPPAVGPLPAPGEPTDAATTGLLYEFLRKVLKLLSFRLSALCESFDFAPMDRNEVITKVYETLEHALYYQTHLFYGRHIDQVLLSALYGFCKVHKLNQVSFREIITQYRKQPQSTQPIFRSVVLEQTSPGLQPLNRGDIIAFYNQTFVPAMRAYLLKVESAGRGVVEVAGQPLGLPPLPPSARNSPHKHHHAARLPPLSGNGGSGQTSPSGRSFSPLSQRPQSSSHQHGSGNSTVASLGVSPVASPTAGSNSSSHPSPNLLAGIPQAGNPRMRSRSSDRMPSGLATLLRALDTTQNQSTGSGTQDATVTDSSTAAPLHSLSCGAFEMLRGQNPVSTLLPPVSQSLGNALNHVGASMHGKGVGNGRGATAPPPPPTPLLPQAVAKASPEQQHVHQQQQVLQQQTVQQRPKSALSAMLGGFGLPPSSGAGPLGVLSQAAATSVGSFPSGNPGTALVDQQHHGQVRQEGSAAQPLQRQGSLEYLLQQQGSHQNQLQRQSSLNKPLQQHGSQPQSPSQTQPGYPLPTIPSLLTTATSVTSSLGGHPGPSGAASGVKGLRPGCESDAQAMEQRGAAQGSLRAIAGADVAGNAAGVGAGDRVVVADPSGAILVAAEGWPEPVTDGVEAMHTSMQQ